VDVLAQRLLILVVVLIGLAVVAAALNPGVRTAPPAAQPAPALEAQDPTPPATVARTLDSAEPARTIAVDQGDDVQLTVRVTDLDSVAIPDLGELQAATPDSPAEFDIRADRAGSYPIELGDGTEIGTLRVTATRE
jgi:hypothetical protein